MLADRLVRIVSVRRIHQPFDALLVPVLVILILFFFDLFFDLFFAFLLRQDRQGVKARPGRHARRETGQHRCAAQCPGQVAGGALKATGAALPGLPAAAAGAGILYGGQTAASKVKDMLDNYNLGPRERELKTRLNSISGLSPHARILATEQLRKDQARYYQQMYKSFGGKGVKAVERSKYY